MVFTWLCVPIFEENESLTVVTVYLAWTSKYERGT